MLCPAEFVSADHAIDEQNRLTWASSQTGTGPCGAQNTAGTLSSQGAPYTASYSYDALNRLTSSPLGSYSYASAHLHAVSSVTSGSTTVYSAQYGSQGSMYCRAASSSATCQGSTYTGAYLHYDAQGQLIAWQNTWTNPTATASYAYDGAGQRVAQSVTTSGVTSTTWYIGGGLEELTVSGTTSTLTKYESVPGVCNAVIVGSGPSEAISYVTSDGLGSVSEALDGSGHVTAQQLYGPYGGMRYSSGTMPTAKGFTGQYADAASSGLDYYGARYYDPLLGQFTSADTDAKGGLNRYAYVAGNPETATDPTGHLFTCQTGCGGGGGGSTPTGGNGTGGGNGGCQTNCDGGGGGGSCNYAACHRRGGGGDGGCHSGCNTRTDLGALQDTCDKICRARNIASSYAANMFALAAALADLRDPSKSFILGLLSKIPFAGPWLDGLVSKLVDSPVGEAVTAIVAVLAGEALTLALLFTWQASWSAAMWENKGWFDAMTGAVQLTLFAGGMAVGMETAALTGAITDALGGGPEDPAGDVAAGVVATIAGLVGASADTLYFGVNADQTLSSESNVLWGS